MALRGSHRHGPRGAAGLALVAAICTLAACADSGGRSAGSGPVTSRPPSPARVERVPVPVQELEIDASEYAFEISPDPAGGLRPGWTEVTFHNVGAEAHQVMFARLKDGVDMGALAAAGAGDSSGAGAIEFVDMIGGVSYIDPGNDITAMVDLPAGTVMAMCYVPTDGGVAHALLGMSTMLQVSEPPADPPATGAAPDTGPTSDPPAVRGTIELSGDGYEIPSPLATGWYHVRNTDTDEPALGLHELSLLHLDRSLQPGEVDQLVDDLAANRTPAVGLDAVGGLGAVSAGFDGFLYLDLPPGDYLAVDFMPDPGDPRPHMLDGYHATFRR